MKSIYVHIHHEREGGGQTVDVGQRFVPIFEIIVQGLLTLLYYSTVLIFSLLQPSFCLSSTSMGMVR